MMADPTPQRFELFPSLPVELRLKIWRMTLMPRIFEIQLKLNHTSDETLVYETNNVIPTDLRPLSRPEIPVILHVCRESREETLSVHQICSGAGFKSPYPYPYNLCHPALDTLFVPIALYYLNASEMRLMFSSTAASSLGLPREFILDLLAQNPADVAAVTSLAVCWADMHIKDVSTLTQALEPYRALRELIIIFFEKREDKMDIRFINANPGQLKPALLSPDKASVRGRYLERILDEYMQLAIDLNKSFREAEADDLMRQTNFPEIKIRVVRFRD